MDALKSDVVSGAVLLLGVLPERVVLLGWASDDVAKKFPVSDLVKSFSARLGGRGGGKPIWAEGGGPLPENLDSLLAEMREIGSRTFGEAFSD
jgi:alanyl-tRNA synthetase